MKKFWIIRNARGEVWQATKGFMSTNLADATKYTTRDDAIGARGFVVSNKVASQVVEIDQ
jgi:hypothetical protein